MKTVQDKNGNILEVADNTPCHAGKNGQLPVLLDEVKDKKVFDELAARQAEWEAKAPERALNAAKEKRNAERGTWQEQWEYFIDRGYAALKQRDDEIKTRNPFPPINGE